MSTAKIKHYALIAVVVLAVWFAYSRFVAPRMHSGK